MRCTVVLGPGFVALLHGITSSPSAIAQTSVQALGQTPKSTSRQAASLFDKVSPLLNRYCAGCNGGTNPPGGRLSFANEEDAQFRCRRVRFLDTCDATYRARV